eukprot:m.9317 g.9317  ORF g.9317 m.9317 type:complete len:71 (-) comp5440_c0_seq1:1920-2132(-)
MGKTEQCTLKYTLGDKDLGVDGSFLPLFLGLELAHTHMHMQRLTTLFVTSLYHNNEHGAPQCLLQSTGRE